MASLAGKIDCLFHCCLLQPRHLQPFCSCTCAIAEVYFQMTLGIVLCNVQNSAVIYNAGEMLLK